MSVARCWDCRLRELDAMAADIVVTEVDDEIYEQGV